MTFSKIIRRANHILREARKYRKIVIVVMGLFIIGLVYISSQGLVLGGRTLLPPSNSLSTTLKKLEGLTIDQRFLWRHKRPLGAHPQIALVGINTSSLDQGELAALIEKVEKSDAEKANAPKPDAPKPDTAPKADTPKQDAPKPDDAPKADAPKADAPKQDAPKPDDAPKADAPKVESAQQAAQPQTVSYAEALKLMAQGSWPFPRGVYAYAIDRLFELGAKVIAIDVLFVSQRGGDEDFAAILKKYPGRVVLASSKNFQEDDEGNKRSQILRPNAVLTEGLGEDGVGYAFFQPDPDGIVRRVERTTSQFKESDLAHLQSGSDDWIRFSPLAVQKFTGQPAVPGRELINYRGAAGTHMVYPIEEIFVDPIVNSDPRYQGGNIFKDKLVFIGPISETFHDEHPTPLGTQPGVEIHVHYAGTLLDKIPIREVPEKFEILLVVAMVVLAALLAFTVERVLLRFAVGGLGAFAYGYATYYVFTDHRAMLPMALPLLGFVVEGGLITLFDFAVEQIERAHVKSVLDKYVSSNVANLVVNQGDSFEQALRGQTKPVSVLFSDIRGFTTLSESRSPETLVSQLNEYFLPMVDKVLVEGGTLQKFIGDAIMAVWGDTHSLGLETDCSHAVRAALKMRTALELLNAGWKGRDDRLELSIGIGINHGTVVVGELGHPQRMEFTVLGDGVNLAARLESATKQFGCDILVGETAEALTRNQFVFRRVDRAVFKGKTQPIEVFTPLGEVGIEVPGWLTRYHEALDLYYQQKFEEAKNQMDAVNSELGGDDYICKMYKKRCDHYLKEPPGADWNGAWVLSEK